MVKYLKTLPHDLHYIYHATDLHASRMSYTRYVMKDGITSTHIGTRLTLKPTHRSMQSIKVYKYATLKSVRKSKEFNK